MLRRASFLVVGVLWALAARASMDTVMTGVIRLGYPVRAVVDNGLGQIYLLTGRGLERKTPAGFELVDPDFRQMPCIVDGQPVECTTDPAFRERPYFEAHAHWQAQFPGDTKRYTEARDADGQLWVCTGTELYTFELQPRPSVFLPGQSVRGLLFDAETLYANTYEGFFVGDSCVWRTEALHAGNILMWRDTLYSFCHGFHQWPGRSDGVQGDLLFADGRAMVDEIWHTASSAVGPIQFGCVHQDTLWICGQHGIGWWDGAKSIVATNENLNIQSICTVHGDLMAFPRWGGAMIRSNSGGAFEFIPELPRELIFSQALEVQGPEPLNAMVAFATNKGIGIWREDDKSFSLLTIRDGLPSNMICELAQDEWGHLWASTFTGLVRISLTHDYIDTFLPTVEFNRGSHFYDPSTKTHYWGSIDGVYATQLNAFPKPKISPEAAKQDEDGQRVWAWFCAVGLFVLIVLFFVRQSRKLRQSEADLFISHLESLVLSRLPNVSVESLAEAAEISLRTLYRRMEEHGWKPGEFLREIRLKQARALLDENDGLSLAEVASRVGYSEAHLRRLLDEAPET